MEVSGEAGAAAPTLRGWDQASVTDTTLYCIALSFGTARRSRCTRLEEKDTSWLTGDNEGARLPGCKQASSSGAPQTLTPLPSHAASVRNGDLSNSTHLLPLPSAWPSPILPRERGPLSSSFGSSAAAHCQPSLTSSLGGRTLPWRHPPRNLGSLSYHSLSPPSLL